MGGIRSWAVVLAVASSGGCKLSSEPVPADESADAAAPGSADAAAVEDPADGQAEVGSLTASVSPPQLGFGEPVDLSATGGADWVHWGLAGEVGAYNHKSGVGAPISDYSQLGTATLLATNCCIETGFSWTDGTPSEAAAGAIGGIYVDTANPSGDGFRFTVPADTDTRTLRVYTGNWCVRAKLAATLSDGSAAPLEDTSFEVATATLQNAIYTITFRAASSGQTLSIDYTIDENHCIDGDVGELHLFAAAW